MSDLNLMKVGDGKVVLIAGGGKIYTDVAARFCRTEKDLDKIISSPYNKKLVQTILDSGHGAALEFDYFIFGVQGYSRVTETQLVRKRMASYLIKSGRVEEHGKRNFDVVLPSDSKIMNVKARVKIPITNGHVYTAELSTIQLLSAMQDWYDNAIANGVKEEDARYLKPQATEFKAIIGMNAHALRDWFKIRCCNRAQSEIRDMAWKMLKLCKEVAPDLFYGAGPSCKADGFCPEMEQCAAYKGKIPTKKQWNLFKENHPDEYKELISKLTTEE